MVLTCVLIAAQREEKAFWEDTRRVLCENYSTLIVQNQSLFTPATPPELIVCDAAAFESVAAENTIILFRNTVKIPAKILSSTGCVAVVDSQDDALMQFVSGTRLPAITCGLSPRDTITLSSIDTDSAVINLQRSVTCFDGSAPEPQEFPVRLNTPIDNFSLMAVACVFILCGDAQRFHRVYI